MKSREFFRHSAAATAVLGFPMARRPEGARRHPNDRIPNGFIGLGGRTRWILRVL